MTALDYLNSKFVHPDTIIFDETSLMELIMIASFLTVAAVGLFVYWPISAVAGIFSAILLVLAWHDFIKYIFQARKLRASGKTRRTFA